MGHTPGAAFAPLLLRLAFAVLSWLVVTSPALAANTRPSPVAVPGPLRPPGPPPSTVSSVSYTVTFNRVVFESTTTSGDDAYLSGGMEITLYQGSSCGKVTSS